MRSPALALLLLCAGPAVAAPRDDPKALIPSARPPVSAGETPCGPIPARPLALADLVDIALCNNPQTSVSWAGVRAAAAQVGIARSAYLPSVDLNIGTSLNRNDRFSGSPFGSGNDTEVDTSAQLAINYLLFDFGGRAASVDAARAGQRAALAQYADAAQEVALATVTAFNSVNANRAAETAAVASLEFARASFRLSDARKIAGVATGADRLQALTAQSQAELTLIQARGNAATAQAQLAVTIGLPPTVPLSLAPPPPLTDGALLRSGAATLIADAERLRPDIAAARANVEASAADVRAAQALGRPTIGLSASNGVSAIDRNITGNSGQVGVTVSVPLFSGFNTRYQIAAARARAEQQAALAEQTRQQAGLAVYSNYVALDTSLRALTSARALIASAQASADIAQGRYRAGVGLFTDLLNAQSALTSARTQLVQAEFNVRTANAQLARAIGGIGEAIDLTRTTNGNTR